MRPALSIVFFTTLSGAGYGLLFWLGVVAVTGRDGALGLMAFWASLLAIGLITLGLLCSLAHLGQPQRAWRALSQWRTSWLSREGVMALVTYVPALAMTLGFWCPDFVPSGLMIVAGLATSLLALATVCCTAMIYASLKPIPAWRHPLVMPVYLLLALLSGASLFAMLLSSGAGVVTGAGAGAVAIAGADAGALERIALIGLAIAAALAKLIYWRAIDRAAAPDRASAVGLKGRKVHVFEAPHTEANYITREFAFQLARSHAGKLRLLSAVLLAVIPVLLIGSSQSAPEYAFALFALNASSILAGIFLERWLFFAQARHLVTAYY